MGQIPPGKKQYHVTLNEASTEKAVRILGLGNLTLSVYLSTILDEFVLSMDESGFSKVLDKGVKNLSAVDAMAMIARMLKGSELNEKLAKKKKK